MSKKSTHVSTDHLFVDTDRRRFLKDLSITAVSATAVATLPTEASAQKSNQKPNQRPSQKPAPAPAAPEATVGPESKLFATVDTTSGKVQGIITAGIRQFKGIPYGASTAGKNRFMPPKKPTPWTGVRECFGHGQCCPQTPSNLRSDYGMMILWDQQSGGMGEDCLVLNIWTPGTNDGAKRAVLVSFHGGGYATGSGNAPGFDGAQLALFGDVVVVTVNHRLSSFGYTHLADLGAPPEFASAGVTGIMDLVASLEWVKANIENFGGDPGRVMIFGQSGGGAKTSAVLATPAAKGLFHRAAVQSGSSLRFTTREAATRAAEQLLTKLNIPKTRISDLQKISWQQLLEAQTGIAGFSPVMDGTYLPHHPFDPVAPPESADVPMIVSTTLEDAALSLTNFNLDEAGLKTMLDSRFQNKGEEILAMYRRRYPQKSPFLIQAQALTDAGFRRSAITQAERKAALGKGPAWMYLWSWESPAYDGRYGAVHGLDVSASFHGVRDNIVGVGVRDAKVMCDRLSSAWVAFAKTGDPNNPRIPEWPKYDATSRATMVFDTDTRVENDPRGEIRKYWSQQVPAPTPGSED